jgi:hypothetical protein
MKKMLVLTAVVGMCMSFLVFSVGAEEEHEVGFFFCNRDVEEFASIGNPGEAAVEKNQGGENVVVIPKNPNNKHTLLRHCFTMTANKINETTDTMMYLGVFASLGYYPIGVKDEKGEFGNVQSENFWLLNPNEIKSRVVSCKPVLVSNSTINKSTVMLAWNTFFSEVVDDVKNNPYYNQRTHNCCSVTWKGLRETRKKLLNTTGVDIDLANIDKRGYNGLGTGITFDRTDDSVFNIMEGVASTTSDSSRVLFKGIRASITKGVSDDGKKDDL